MSKESTIEKYHRECLAFNRAAGYTIDETEFDITVAQTALQELYHLYEAGIASDKFQRDKDYVVRAEDIVRVIRATLCRWDMTVGMNFGEQYDERKSR